MKALSSSALSNTDSRATTVESRAGASAKTSAITIDAAHLAVFQASRARLFSLAYQILGVRAEAEDVVQDAFIKWHLLRGAAGTGKEDSLDRPQAWLTTVTKRSAIDRLRHLKYQMPLPANGEPPEGVSGVDAPACAPSAQTLAERNLMMSEGMRRVLNRLNAEEQTAFLLREAFDTDYERIAKLLNRNAAHCRQIVHRAKIRLRDDTANAPLNGNAPVNVPDEQRCGGLLDAIARQDVDALLSLTRAGLPLAVSAEASLVSADSLTQEAQRITAALIMRLGQPGGRSSGASQSAQASVLTRLTAVCA